MSDRAEHRRSFQAERHDELVTRVRRLIEAGRADGSIPPGPPATALAAGLLAAIEGAVIALAGHPEHDEEIAERVARGLAGVPR